MSLGIGAHANIVLENEHTVIYEYGEYSGRFYTPIPEIGNRSSDVKETALPF